MMNSLTPRPHRPSPCHAPAIRIGHVQRAVIRCGLILGILSAGMTAWGSASQEKAISPTGAVALFNGRDLSPFVVWLPSTGGHADPDRVFTVVDNIDGAPAIRSSGQHFGGLLTRQSFKNYRLIVEFRWGLVTWKPRMNRARDNGILLHCQGEPGNAGKNFDSPWMRSVEFQIIEGGTGDIILVGGFDRATGRLIPAVLSLAVQPGQKNWDPTGIPTEFTKGRINWQYR
ncbi:MAG: DUF1080 domain-containing protein, partial [Opitutaceae bacterium]|nr:DUF1080 domain-containing protein [Opitutaceae bacterium]